MIALGYRVTRLAARVFQDGSVVGPPFDHLTLRVDLDEPWLVDVGFGRHAIYPLRLTEHGDQLDPAGRFQLRPHGPSGDLDLLRDGTRAYRIEDRSRSLADFRATCWYQQTSPDPMFTRILICSLPLATGRVTLYGQLLIRTNGTERTEEHLTETDTLAAYREIFGIELDCLPCLPVNGTRPAQPVPAARP